MCYITIRICDGTIAQLQTDIVFFIPYFKYLPLSLSSSICHVLTLSLSLSIMVFFGMGRGSGGGIAWHGVEWFSGSCDGFRDWVFDGLMGGYGLLMGWSMVDGFGYRSFMDLAGFRVWWVWLWFVGGDMVWWRCGFDGFRV